MKQLRFREFVLIAALAALLTACSSVEPVISDTMVRLNLKEPAAPEELILAVPVPMQYAGENTTYLEGIQLAVEDMEAMEFPIPLRVQLDDDSGEFGQAIVLARSYIDDPAVIGVIGHWYSDICLPISDTYASGEQVLIVPTVSIPSLTRSFSDYVFRNIPDDDQVGRKMCDYVRRGGAKNVVVYYEDSSYGFELAAGIERYAMTIGMSVVDRVCEPTLDRELPNLMRKWSAMDFDTVMVVSNVEEGAAFINALADLGFDGRVVCSDGMDSDSVLALLTPGDIDVGVCSIFNAENPPEGVLQFQRRFRERFGKEPDVWAVQGYDCVSIVARAVSEHGVKTTQELSEYFRSGQSLGSIYGDTRFDDRNEIIGKNIMIKTIRSGVFQSVS